MLGDLGCAAAWSTLHDSKSRVKRKIIIPAIRREPGTLKEMEEHARAEDFCAREAGIRSFRGSRGAGSSGDGICGE